MKKIQNAIYGMPRALANHLLDLNKNGTNIPALPEDLKIKLSRMSCADYKRHPDGNQEACFKGKDEEQFDLSLRTNDQAWTVIYKGAKSKIGQASHSAGYIQNENPLSGTYSLTNNDPLIPHLQIRMQSFEKNTLDALHNNKKKSKKK